MSEATTTSEPRHETGASDSLARRNEARTERNRSADDLPVTSIRPPSLLPIPDIGELWQYRDLLLLLARRNIAATYRMSVLGVGWSVVKPLFTTAIFTFVVVYVLKVRGLTGDIPYPVFTLAGLLPWTFFATSLTSATASVVNAQSMLTKVYFPRMVLPISSLAVASVEVLIQCVLLLGMMFIYGVPFGPRVMVTPLFLGLAVLAALAGGLWLTALNVRFRDVQFVLPFVIQLMMYLCPIIYPASRIPERFRTLYFLNPMAGVVEGFRWSMIGTSPPPWTMFALSAAATLVILFTGMLYFARTEQTFADVI